MARISIFLIIVALIAGMVGCGGDGTPSQNLEIYDWYDLNAVRNNLTGSYLLMNNLNSTTPGYTELASPTANGGKGWEPIGNLTGGNFAGSFDGQGYEIKDMFINRPDEPTGIGLFCIVDEEGRIENVGMVNVDVTSSVSASLVGINIGSVSNSYATGSVAGSESVGGMVAINDGTMSNSYFTGIVVAIATVGGLVGMNGGIVNNCYSSGNVTGYSYVGGLVGANSGNVSNSYATGSVTGNSSVGGLVAENFGSVVNSYSISTVTGYSSVGGLVGLNDWGSTVSNSFWDTQTSGQNISAGGTGKNTTEMQNIITFSGATWDITTVSGIGERNTGYIWNIVHSVTYPFLSWQP